MKNMQIFSLLSLLLFGCSQTPIFQKEVADVKDKQTNTRSIAEVRSTEAKKLTATNYKPGIVRHIVSFKFQPTVTQAQIDNVIQRFLQLKTEGLRYGRTYIKSIEVGSANSFEGADQGKQITFIVTFKSQGDRNYYVGQPLISENDTDYYDSAHLGFKRFVGPLLATPVVPEGVFVFDFTV